MPGGGGFGQFADLWGPRSKRGGGVFKVEGWQVDTPLSTMWIFANPCVHYAVTRLENIYQLNWKSRQKAGCQFVT